MSSRVQLWTDAETTALIDAWAPLHLRHPDGIPAEDWSLIAGAVNEPSGSSSASASGRRTVAQCKRRVRTLLKNKRSWEEKPRPSWLSGAKAPPYLTRLRAMLATPDGPPPGFPPRTSWLSGSKAPPYLTRLRAMLATPDGPPPGFPPRMPASVKKEMGKEEEIKEEEEEEVIGAGGVGGGLTGTSWPAVVPRKPRNGCSSAAAVVTKLAEVYERVETAWLEAGKEKKGMQSPGCSCGDRKPCVMTDDHTDTGSN